MRDSTRQQANQPFTLMVYYQDKVYNIQIRQQNQQFVLGTGLKVQEVKSWILQSYSQHVCLLQAFLFTFAADFSVQGTLISYRGFPHDVM